MSTSPAGLDAWALLELCTGPTQPTVALVQRLHGGRPRIFRQDFAGSGVVGRAFARQVRGASAVLVDPRKDALVHAVGAPGVRTVAMNPLRCNVGADVTCALGFSLGGFHSRRELLRYLRLSRKRLNPGGILLADLYGGARAWLTGSYTQVVEGPAGAQVEYIFEQVEGRPLTGLVRTALHFRVSGPGRARARWLRNAFTFHWRLWGVRELLDVMEDAGFSAVAVFDQAVDQRRPTPLTDHHVMDDDWVVWVTARR